WEESAGTAPHLLTLAVGPDPVGRQARRGHAGSLSGAGCRLRPALGQPGVSSPAGEAAGGHIWLTVEPQGSDVVVKVRDTGVGIPRDVLPTVFDMFTQADRSVERSQGGLGIGLSLVRGLVEMHGGRVEAHSEGPGRGS